MRARQLLQQCADASTHAGKRGDRGIERIEELRAHRVRSWTARLLLTAAQRASISCPTGRENPMEHPDEIRRKRLRFRSWHRGTKESDLDRKSTRLNSSH